MYTYMYVLFLFPSKTESHLTTQPVISGGAFPAGQCPFCYQQPIFQVGGCPWEVPMGVGKATTGALKASWELELWSGALSRSAPSLCHSVHLHGAG